MTNLWTRCNSCQRIIYKQDILDNLYVCPVCQFHFRVEARQRVEMLLDPGSYVFIDENIYPLDPLGFEDSLPYAVRLKENQEKTSLPEAVITAVGAIGGFKVVLAVMEFNFMGGSMGSVVGEKITRAAERALAEGIPLIVVSCSGGARMQEGALSLMQLIKTSSALARLDEAGIPYISILTDPTTGGVSASYGMLGDINIGEPGALIGFAGPRVIEQTIKEKLPKGFQRAEFLLQHGMLDDVVNRKNLRGYLLRIIRLLLNCYEK
ncbi:MAG: acetyl-CoA carboxylase, carboxyltransferase subunit beta [Candidatus Aminicenantales bacterium]